MYKDNQQVININLNDILPNRFQPRLKFNEDEIINLSESIKEHGVIQPIVVRKLGDRYEIIAGERRTKASIMAGKTTIPAIVVDLNDNESAEVALIENVQRQDLTSIEEAISYRKILDMGYLTQSQLAEKVGKKQSTIANKLRLLTLPKSVQDALLETKISERHARSLLRLDDKQKQEELLDRIIKERLTVRRTDQEIDKIINLDKMEILDIPLVPETVKKEDDIVNDKRFDFDDMIIPTTSIIDGNLNINKADNITEVTNFNNSENISNPGFMDIDKIADQAQDIKKDNVSFDLQPDQIIPSIPEEPKPEEIPMPKFFNILNETKPVEKSETDEKSINNVSPLNGLDIFNVQNTQTEPKTIPEPDNISVSTVTEQQPPEIKIDNAVISNDLDDIAIIDDNTFVSEEVPQQETKIETHKPLLKDAIAEVRNLSHKLENMGYIIDIEEIDFEDLYQIIFKIKK
ncbi:MAG: ParB/RepB/Spo0J family partition protein [Bacilli bacterium]